MCSDQLVYSNLIEMYENDGCFGIGPSKPIEALPPQ